MRDLLEKANTEVPWVTTYRNGSHRIDTPGWPVADCGVGGADAALIVAAVNALPALLDVVDAARAVSTAESDGQGERVMRARALVCALAKFDEVSRPKPGGG